MAPSQWGQPPAPGASAQLTQGRLASLENRELASRARLIRDPSTVLSWESSNVALLRKPLK